MMLLTGDLQPFPFKLYDGDEREREQHDPGRAQPIGQQFGIHAQPRQRHAARDGENQPDTQKDKRPVRNGGGEIRGDVIQVTVGEDQDDQQ
ncbi:MAG: hypothetical protein BWY76_03452 [bacterium ADurb.Bin429]|nr:MAG: hypothetical protein BWY76_03452 [bacterium ADurb.Bin429]